MPTNKPHKSGWTQTRWKPEWDQFLTENYNTLGQAGCSKALHVPRVSVARHAKQLGLCRREYLPYTQEEKDIIATNHQTKTAKEIAGMIHRPPTAISAYLWKQRRNGVLPPKPFFQWTKDNKEKFKRLYNKHFSDRKIAEKLGCDAGTIARYRNKRGLPGGARSTPTKPWTQEDIDWLLSHYDKHNVKECAEHLDRTPESVYQKVSRLRRQQTAEGNASCQTEH